MICEEMRLNAGQGYS